MCKIKKIIPLKFHSKHECHDTKKRNKKTIYFYYARHTRWLLAPPIPLKTPPRRGPLPLNENPAPWNQPAHAGPTPPSKNLRANHFARIGAFWLDPSTGNCGPNVKPQFSTQNRLEKRYNEAKRRKDFSRIRFSNDHQLYLNWTELHVRRNYCTRE